jgi:hypothetical protein
MPLAAPYYQQGEGQLYGGAAAGGLSAADVYPGMVRPRVAEAVPLERSAAARIALGLAGAAAPLQRGASPVPAAAAAAAAVIAAAPAATSSAPAGAASRASVARGLPVSVGATDEDATDDGGGMGYDV